MFKTSILIVIFIIVGKLLSFAKDIAISSYFGIGLDTDAFFIAFNTTTIVFVAFYSTISLVFLPMYNENKIKYGNHLASKFTSNILNIYLIITFFVMIFTIYFAPFIVSLVNHSPSLENISLTTTLLRIMTLSFLFTIFISFMTTIQLSNEQYLIPHIIPIINNLTILIAIVFLSNKYGIVVPAIAGVIGWIVQAPLHKYIVNKSFKYKLYINIKDSSVKKMALMFLPAFLGVFVDQSNMMVDTILASGLEAGNVSALNYSNRLISFSSGIFIMAIMTIMYPIFSKYIVNNEIKKLTTSIQMSIRVLLLVMLPITVIVVIFSQEIVTIVFQRGEFDNRATTMTSSVLFFYSFGILFIGLRELFNKVFYAQKDAKTPLYISIFAVSINIILSINLSKIYGIDGLAIATSISLFLYVLIQVIVLQNKIGKVFYKSIPMYLLKLLISLITSVFMLLIYKDYFKSGNLYFDFLSSTILFFLFYAIILFFLKNEDITVLYNKLLKKDT